MTENNETEETQDLDFVEELDPTTDDGWAPEYREHRIVGPVTTGATAGTGVAGALGVLLIWILDINGVEVPAEVAGAIVVLIGAIGTLLAGWLVKPQT